MARRRAAWRSSVGGAIAQRQLSVKRNRLFKQYFFTSGRHYWEVTIRRTSSAGGCASAAAPAATVVVGIAANEKFECESLSGPDAFSSSSWSSAAIGYASSGAIVKNGVVIGYGEPYKEGDTVGVLLDMNDRSVVFFLNDEEQRPALKASWSSVDGEQAADSERDEEQKQESSSAMPLPASAQIDCSFGHHSVFPALTYGVETDQVEFAMCYSAPKHIHVCM